MKEKGKEINLEIERGKSMKEKGKEINLEIERGRLIPGFEGEGIPFFIIKSDDNFPLGWQLDLPKEEKIYCADCGDLVEGHREVLYIDAEIRAKKGNYARKRICNACCEKKYAELPRIKSSPIPLDKVHSTTLGSVINTVPALHSPRNGITDTEEAKKDVLDLFFDYFDRPAYVADDGEIYVSIHGRMGKLDNKHVEGKDSFLQIGAHIPKEVKKNEEVRV